MKFVQNNAGVWRPVSSEGSAILLRGRVERLRERHLNTKYTASIERLRIETRVMKETEGEPMVIRRAKVFAAVCREMPIEIWPDELIVGHAGARPLCRDVIPDDCPVLLKGQRLTSLMVDTIEYELKDFDPADQKELIEDIAPYWRGSGDWERSHTGSNIRALPDYLKDLLLLDTNTFPPKQSLIYTPFFISGGHYGHNSISYPEVLEKGLLGIKKDAEAKLTMVKRNDGASRTFLEAVVLALGAAINVGKRFADKARELARKEEDLVRKSELGRIATICDRVPAYPARTFYETLQSIFLTQVLLNWESPMILSQTTGRIDQYLLRYVEENMRQGTLKEEKAQELLDCYLIKLNHVNRGNHLAVGGYRADGRDGTNLLSYMLIESMKHVRLAHPFISVLIHARTPQKLLIKAAELSALGTGHPIYLNADVLTTQMLARGSIGGSPVTLELARTATPVGCYEPIIMGLDSGYMYGGYFNLAAICELVLTNGSSRRYGKKIGQQTGDPRSFTSFEAFKEAYRAQLSFMMKNFSAATNVFERVLADLLPTPFESCLIKDCIIRGKSREDGGARFNFRMVIGAGSSDAGDSLTAIRKLVFDEKKIAMDDLCQALEANFEGHEDIRNILCAVSKFGNDDDYADEQVAWVSHVFAEEVAKQKDTRGGHAVPMGAPLQYYMFGGWVVGALPSGRKAWEPLSDAWSPCAGCDVNGPTAILSSMGKINHAELTAGVTLNLRLDPSIFRNRDGVHRFVNFIRAFADQGIFQVQFNIIDTKTLREAQKEPEKYRDLIIKVAGYSAYFTQLIKPLQDGVIARTEHTL
ncbi:MAG: pyruvate formate lyase family protein [Promethearchaeota archaeon]